jgi:hypothetical protein
MASDATEEYFSIAEDAPEGTCGFVTEYSDKTWLPNNVCCWRETWNDTGRCIWHGESNGKTVKELRSRRAEGPERLDGANIEGLELDNVISFSDCVMVGASFSDASLHGVDLSNAFLNRANLSDAALWGADLSDIDLRRADLSDVDFRRANLSDAYLSEASLTDANLREAAFYGAIFDGTQIDAATRFGGHYDDEMADGDPREYDRDEPSPWDKAAFTYRQIERLSRDIALSDQSRWAYRSRKDVRRREYRRTSGLSKKVRWLKAEGSRWLTNYGDGPWHVVGTSLVVMVLWAFLYPLVGGIDVPPTPEDTDTVVWEVFPKVVYSLPDPLAEFATSLYFSVVTFTTLGYGDLQPATGAAQALATIESFVGALLMALLVFVLGRRTTW